MTEQTNSKVAAHHNPIDAPQDRQRLVLALTHNALQITQGLQQLPRQQQPSVERWIAENQHWHAILRALNTLCQNCGNAYPQIPLLDITHRPTYPALVALIDADLCAQAFSNRLQEIARHFRLYRVIFGAIPDAAVRNAFIAMVDQLSATSQQLQEDLKSPPKAAITPNTQTIRPCRFFEKLSHWFNDSPPNSTIEHTQSPLNTP